MGVYMCSTGRHIAFISVSPMQSFECDCPKQCREFGGHGRTISRCSLSAGHEPDHKFGGTWRPDVAPAAAEVSADR